MKPDLKEKWIAALRSGEYVQGRSGYLYRDKTYCCLGVLAEIDGKLSDERYIAGIGTTKGFGSCYGNLPKEYIEEIELKEKYSQEGSSVSGKLINMNDLRNFSFDEIADWIEENL